jgi:hypothetical protein
VERRSPAPVTPRGEAGAELGSNAESSANLPLSLPPGLLSATGTQSPSARVLDPAASVRPPISKHFQGEMEMDLSTPGRQPVEKGVSSAAPCPPSVGRAAARTPSRPPKGSGLAARAKSTGNVGFPILVLPVLPYRIAMSSVNAHARGEGRRRGKARDDTGLGTGWWCRRRPKTEPACFSLPTRQRARHLSSVDKLSPRALQISAWQGCRYREEGGIADGAPVPAGSPSSISFVAACPGSRWALFRRRMAGAHGLHSGGSSHPRGESRKRPHPGSGGEGGGLRLA